MSHSKNFKEDLEQCKKLAETGRLNSKLKVEMQAILEKIQEEANQSQLRMQQEVKQKLELYGSEMEKLITSSDFLTPQELEKNHDKLQGMALDELMDIQDIPDNAADFRLELIGQILQKYEDFKVENEKNRNGAFQKAQIWVQKNYEGFQKLVETELEIIQGNVTELAKKAISTEFGPGSNPSLVRHAESQLESLNGTLFKSLRKAIDENRVANLKTKQAENTQKIIETILESSKSQYDTKTQEILQKYPNGLEIKTLEKLLDKVRVEVVKLFEMEFQNKVGADDSFPKYRKSLTVHIENGWLEVVKSNKRKLTLAEKEANLAEAVASLSISKKTLRVFEEPLVFHIWAYIYMVVNQNDQILYLNNELAGGSTPATVVVNSESKFLYGTEAKTAAAVKSSVGLPRNKPPITVWKLRDFMDNSVFETHSITVNEKKEIVTAELIFAFLLGKLKQSAEKQLNGRFTKTLLAIPFWLSSTQRIMFKDAAQIAGFGDVHLVNDTSAAAYSNFISNPPLKNDIAAVLVIYEEMGHVYTFVYQYSTSEQNLELIDQNSDNFGMNKLESGSVEEVASRIRGLCKASIENAKNITQKPVHAICLNLSQSQFDIVEYALEGLVKICKEPDFLTRVSTGAAALAKQFNQIGSLIRDKLPADVMSIQEGGATQLLFSADELLPVESTSKGQPLWLGTMAGQRSVEIRQELMGKSYQVGIFKCNETIPLGELLQTNFFFGQSLEANFELNKEGIVRLEGVSLLEHLLGSRSTTNFDETKYEWKIPNLTKEEIQRLSDFLAVIIE